MKTSLHLLSLTALLCLATIGWTSTVDAGLITVGQDAGYDFTSVQAAIDSASTGDTITVAPGYYVEGTATYYGNGFSTGLAFQWKNDITVIGAGADRTVIDFNNSTYGVLFTNGNGNTISDLAMWKASYYAVCDFNGSVNNLIRNAIFGGTYTYGTADYYNGVTYENVTWDPDFVPSIPEPSALALALIGCAGVFLGVGRRKR